MFRTPIYWMGEPNQFMKKVWMMFFSLILLSGCRIELSLDESSSHGAAAPSNAAARSQVSNTMQKEPLSVFINGDIEYDETLITLNVDTELKKGTVLKVLLREYPEVESLRDIFDGKVEPNKTPIFEETKEVDQKGDFTLEIEREEDKLYSLSVEFKPDIQPDAIKEVYGSRGEEIVVARNIEHYEIGGETMIGVSSSSYVGIPPGWGMLE